jgi:hypothetical protein
MTNGFCRSPPLRFTISGNISVPKNAGCTAFEAKDLIVIVPNGACSLSQTMEYSIQSGAKAVIYHYFEFHTVGKVSRVPFADYIVKIPIVMVSTSYVQQVLIPLLDLHPFVTVEVTAGVSTWHANIFETTWFIILNFLFLLSYIFLLLFILCKLWRKKSWNISAVFLVIQAAFCVSTIIRWVDPLHARGFYPLEMGILTELMPLSLALLSLALMAFFWFDVLNQLTNTKVSPFLSKKKTRY